MASIRADFRAVKEFQKDLDRFKRESTRERKLREVLQPVGALLLAEAQKRVPVRTGALRRSLVVRPLVNGARGAARIGIELGHDGPAGSIAHLVEYGTKSAAAKPYMRPALAATRRKAPELLAAEFRKVLRSAAGNSRTLRLVA